MLTCCNGAAAVLLIGLQNSVGKRSEPESLVHIGFFLWKLVNKCSKCSRLIFKRFYMSHFETMGSLTYHLHNLLLLLVSNSTKCNWKMKIFSNLNFLQLIGYIMKIVGNVSKLSESLPNVHNLHNLCKNLHFFWKWPLIFTCKKQTLSFWVKNMNMP